MALKTCVGRASQTIVRSRGGAIRRYFSCPDRFSLISTGRGRYRKPPLRMRCLWMCDTSVSQVVAYSDSTGFTLGFTSCMEDTTFCETIVKPSKSEYATKSDYFLAWWRYISRLLVPGCKVNILQLLFLEQKFGTTCCTLSSPLPINFLSTHLISTFIPCINVVTLKMICTVSWWYAPARKGKGGNQKKEGLHVVPFP